MSRNFVALAVLALAGAVLVVPDPSFARGGGIRGGGFHAGGLRAPFFGHRPRAGLRIAPRAAFGHRVGSVPLPVAPGLTPKISHHLARTTVRAPFARLGRRNHSAYIYGSSYPITTDDDSAYIGTPYDPGAIPVYGPPPVADQADPAQRSAAPRLSSTRDENQDACRSERVTVPAAEGEREITVVRC